MYAQTSNGSTGTFDSSHVVAVSEVRKSLLHCIAADPNLFIRLATIMQAQIGVGSVTPCSEIFSYLVSFTEKDLKTIGLNNEKGAINGALRSMLYNGLKDFYWQTKEGYINVRRYMEVGVFTEVDAATRQRYEREYMDTLSCIGNIIDLGNLTYKICL